MEKQAAQEILLKGYLAGYMNKEAIDGGKVLEHALPFLPFVGGGASGLYRPAKGTSRFESAAVPGMLGMGGGTMGAIGGGAVGYGLGDQMGFESGGKQSLAAILALAGSSVGTGLGTHLGRLMVQRDVATPEELADAFRNQMAAQGTLEGEKKKKKAVVA